MFAVQRADKIIELLKENEIVLVKDLVELFNVSDVTIRKDLNKLQRQGLITKTHGGAMLNTAKKQPESAPDNTAVTPSPSPRNTVAVRKEKLAAAAYHYLKKGDTIFLGSGYTCTMLAKHIQRSDDLSVITNNLEAALILKDRCRTLILLGGEVNVYDNYTFTTNTQTGTSLNAFNITKAITSCAGIDDIFGVSVSTEVNYKIMESVLQSAHSWYLLVDKSKFDHASPYKLANISDVDTILSDFKDDKYAKYDNIIKI